MVIKMKEIYAVTYQVTLLDTVHVEAESYDEASKLAKRQDPDFEAYTDKRIEVLEVRESNVEIIKDGE